MSCLIEKNDKIILEGSTGLLEDLFYEFQDIIEEENLKINSEFDYFMDKLEKTIFTHGGALVDIAAIFHSSENLQLLIMLLEKTIPRIKYGLKEHAILDLWKFHRELVNYKEELEAAGQ